MDISYRSCSVKYQQTGRNHSKDETLCAILYITKYLPFIDSSSYFLWHNCLGTGCPNTSEQNLSLQKQLIHLMHFAQFKTPAIPLFCSSKLDTVNMIYLNSVNSLMHHISNNSSPQNIKNMSTRSATALHSYNTRFATEGKLL